MGFDKDFTEAPCRKGSLPGAFTDFFQRKLFSDPDRMGLGGGKQNLLLGGRLLEGLGLIDWRLQIDFLD